MHYICENPHKDRTARVCVGETETERVRFTINLTLMLQYTKDNFSFLSSFE